jgi:hypothetical protein
MHTHACRCCSLPGQGHVFVRLSPAVRPGGPCAVPSEYLSPTIERENSSTNPCAIIYMDNHGSVTAGMIALSKIKFVLTN